MRRAFRQARRYAQSLAQPPWPPFIIVLDVGRAFEIYFDFGGNGRDYRFFPDRLSYRVPLASLRDPAIQQRLRAVWTDPKSIDPRSQSAEVTREVAKRLASVSKYVEEGLSQKLVGKSPREKSEEIEEAALFLMRILFCMFAEDIGLLPKDKFSEFLRRAEGNDKLFQNEACRPVAEDGRSEHQPAFRPCGRGRGQIFQRRPVLRNRAHLPARRLRHPRPLRGRSTELEKGRAGNLRDLARTGAERRGSAPSSAPTTRHAPMSKLWCARRSWTCSNPNGPSSKSVSAPPLLRAKRSNPAVLDRHAARPLAMTARHPKP